ncbi:leucyl aminopeptidase [Pleomorphomonas diazotrophica]|uniref:Probable cytosol aminopeptidase n=1 Tax=Pleomorphomonas diazotrophica TaxID=1166257 RepID=A0A1I4U7W5_9HYPH|nr:leucyl aminopeptidase [Pleomorphomonas diazotrophica]PKR91215.1 leucyl aminopeptidase [Pleomorphomonas diazotrophica]SFM84950.1 leucyl aminopeptidase [Pleomorphomonas diazotrophica]
MAVAPTLSFSKTLEADAPVLVVFVDPDNKAGPMGSAVLEQLAGGLDRAVAATGFSGKPGSFLDILAPAGLSAGRLILVGVGPTAEFDDKAALKLGGQVYGKLKEIKAKAASVILETTGGTLTPELGAEFLLGLRLRAYEFDKYKTVKKEDAPGVVAITVVAEHSGKLKKAWAETEAVAEGVVIARDLVHEAPNALGPQEFAAEAEKLKKLGVDVEVLGEKDLRKIGMGALLAVAQGSVRPPRVVIMKWNGGKSDDRPAVFIGKGLVFDSGGISIKPAAGMEDMKADMGGAAAVTGLFRALAGRKAKVNAIGILGIVENMPDGGSYRPGDILTSLSGQTIEVVNTDAEGRLVLADILTYAADRFKPAFMINLATLTGAILVALGGQMAGLFSNDDQLAGDLLKAGEDSGERLWRMPMGPEYDKLIDSRFADMKNSGGRNAGSITAAQFLKRFVGETPWAHLDIAGTAMSSPETDINKAWASGYGVRLLDRLVRNRFES